MTKHEMMGKIYPDWPLDVKSLTQEQMQFLNDNSHHLDQLNELAVMREDIVEQGQKLVNIIDGNRKSNNVCTTLQRY